MKQTKPEWVDRAVGTSKFHKEKLRQFPSWTAKKTAIALNRSIGAISEELMLASFLKTYENDLYKCEFHHEAIEWVRNKKRELDKE